MSINGSGPPLCSAGYNHNVYPVCPSRLVMQSNWPPCDPRPAKIIVSGSRDWEDWAKIYKDLSLYRPGTILVHGAHRNKRQPWKSADHIADVIGKALDFVVLPYPADWDRHGKSAGPLRNEQMIREHPDADAVRAYPLATSIGTYDLIRRAKVAKIPVHYYGPP